MKFDHNKRYQWMVQSAEKWLVIPPLVLFVVIEFFVIFLPTEPIFFTLLFVNPRRWLRFSSAMIGGKLIAVAVVYYGMALIPLEQIHSWAAEWGLSAAWSRCELFFSQYGALSLGITALLPLPMCFVAAIGTVAGTSLASLELFALLGLSLRYAILTYLGLTARSFVEKWILR